MVEHPQQQSKDYFQLKGKKIIQCKGAIYDYNVSKLSEMIQYKISFKDSVVKH